MAWEKKNDKQWQLFIDGERAGDIVLVKYNNGKSEYQGQAYNRKTRSISRVVIGSKLLPVKNAVTRMAKSLRR